MLEGKQQEDEQRILVIMRAVRMIEHKIGLNNLRSN
jgi:hypothetical protein